MSLDMGRVAAAALLVAAYAALCAGIWLRERRRAAQARTEAAALAEARTGAVPLLVGYASQTGHAEEIAHETARLLHAAGEPVRLAALDDIDAALLALTQRALFIASTYGEGDAPDNAAAFWCRCQAGAALLPHLRYGLLALGDRQYAHFCGFGRALDAWLHGAGATPLFARIDMDNANAGALQAWRHQLSQFASLTELPDWQAPTFAAWTLVARRQLNPGSVGAPVVHLELEPPAPTVWEPGDLAEIRVPADPEHPREYSIASIARDGRVHLLVRATTRSDGTPGLASGWLANTQDKGLEIGGAVQMRLRAHPAFRLEGNAAAPIVFIGNGTGLAGLRSHLRARAAAGTGPNWLVFGERNAAHDFLYGDELRGWLASGVLERLDVAFSRDQPQRIHVQDRLAEAADALRDWVERRGAALYVCGSLQGMAQGVDAALRAALGDAQVTALARSGRYRRDVY
ncbi:sulfite reductase subunit alpha [Ramlibacter sp. H39-3-26]|uniref:sulfite reductase subunit alpha n=1 Tax=Curvibacter soli TaxID=3031331 RepID=UPI0023DBF940|nr:sulfite reductase subunit alpha [Ramlibacter sp. H39-3-26]MDF1485858.1 sulfite reductase subunit alpha [Ramlibacter sp. H39-3-26]